jgi:hypothetical protein
MKAGLSQSFSFLESGLKLMGKAGFGPFFKKAFTKLAWVLEKVQVV